MFICHEFSLSLKGSHVLYQLVTFPVVRDVLPTQSLAGSSHAVCSPAKPLQAEQLHQSSQAALWVSLLPGLRSWTVFFWIKPKYKDPGIFK